MDRSRKEGRLERDVHLDVDVRGRERRDGDDRRAEERRVPLVRHEPDERAGDFFAALLARGHVRQDRNRDDAHVERDDGGGNRGRESESEEDVDPHPPGDGPDQQIDATEAKEREDGEHGDEDRMFMAASPWPGEAGAPGAGAAAGAGSAGWCWRAVVIAVRRLQRDRRRAAKRLEGRDHAEDLLIGEADRRLVDGGHRRRESRHDEGGGFVHRLGQVLDIAQARDAALRPGADSPEVGEPERAGLADRVAGQAESFALHDPAADLDHVGRGHVASESRLLGRLHFLLRHHLADIGIEPGRREDERADPDGVRDLMLIGGLRPPNPLTRSLAGSETSPARDLARGLHDALRCVRRGLRGSLGIAARNRAGRAGS